MKVIVQLVENKTGEPDDKILWQLKFRSVARAVSYAYGFNRKELATHFKYFIIKIENDAFTENL